MTCRRSEATWGAMSARGEKDRTVHLLDLEKARWPVAAGILAETLVIGRHLPPRDCAERACIIAMATERGD
jgi:hypothetical protein